MAATDRLDFPPRFLYDFEIASTPARQIEPFQAQVKARSSRRIPGRFSYKYTDKRFDATRCSPAEFRHLNLPSRLTRSFWSKRFVMSNNRTSLRYDRNLEFALVFQIQQLRIDARSANERGCCLASTLAVSSATSYRRVQRVFRVSLRGAFSTFSKLHVLWVTSRFRTRALSAQTQQTSNV